MARNEVIVRAHAAEVFEILTDAENYGFWVVGTKEIRGKDPHWPERGSRFHHRVGVGRTTLDDTSKVLAIEQDRRLVLEARVRPFGTATVELELVPVHGGTATKVVMVETARRGPLRRVWNPVLDAATHVRNVLALRRLKRLAEARVAV
jgi:uncharacterized protein YndB with AHSA1/START domain